MDIAVNALVAQIERKAVEMPGSASLAMPTAAPDELAAARFATIMQSSEVAKAGLPQSASVPTTEPAATPTSLGDRMLASLQGASEDFRKVWHDAETRLKADESLKMQDMMIMQLQISQMAVGYELIGKIVSRSTQNIDQLVRIQ